MVLTVLGGNECNDKFTFENNAESITSELEQVFLSSLENTGAKAASNPVFRSFDRKLDCPWKALRLLW